VTVKYKNFAAINSNILFCSLPPTHLCQYRARILRDIVEAVSLVTRIYLSLYVKTDIDLYTEIYIYLYILSLKYVFMC